jgi:hypothetical protein
MGGRPARRCRASHAAAKPAADCPCMRAACHQLATLRWVRPKRPRHPHAGSYSSDAGKMPTAMRLRSVEECAPEVVGQNQSPSSIGITYTMPTCWPAEFPGWPVRPLQRLAPAMRQGAIAAPRISSPTPAGCLIPVPGCPRTDLLDAMRLISVSNDRAIGTGGRMRLGTRRQSPDARGTWRPARPGWRRGSAGRCGPRIICYAMASTASPSSDRTEVRHG